MEGLPSLLNPALNMKLEKYEDRRGAPKAKGTSYRKAYAQAKQYGRLPSSVSYEDQRRVAVPRR